MIGGHERPDILARVDPDVAKDRPRRLQKPPDRVRNFMAVIDSEGLDAEGPRHLREVGIVGEVDLREILLVEQLLPLADHAELRIVDQHDRSEEHTSELQSLMRISYAVFCLKKKKEKTQ